jgi:HK97 family phage major capsid protein
MNVLERMRQQFADATDQLTALAQRAVDENREMTESEAANAAVLRSNIESLSTRIGDQVSIERSVQTTRDLLSSVPAGQTITPPAGSGTNVMPYQAGMPQVIRTDGRNPDAATIVRTIWQSPGEYMADVIHAQQGDMEARERIQRAIQNEVTGDVPGLVPTPIVGDIINIIDASRPATASARAYGMPQYGASFTRPKVAQHTQVGVQATQKTELTSRKFTVNPLNVNKVTYGGSLDVAFQVIDWTNPSALNAITDDLADQYAIMTEGATCASIGDAATANAANAVTIATNDGAAIMKGLYTAAAKVYAGCKRLPNVLYASVDMWAGLGTLVGTDGRPLFPMMGPTNAPGTMGGANTFNGNPLGLQLVVSPGFAPGTLIMANTAFAEVYEDRRGALRVVEPKLLGWEIAFYGYFSPLMTVDAAFVRITFTIPPVTFDLASFSQDDDDDDDGKAKPAAQTAVKK